MAKSKSNSKSPEAVADSQATDRPPMTVGQLGMWVFISTEIMLFVAIVATYLIFRLSSQGTDWPSPTVMHVSVFVGILNTLILVFSGFAIWASHRAASEDRPAAAKLWLMLTVVLGISFLGVKSYEYYGKYKVGLMPIPGVKQLHDKADFEYLANVNKRLKDSIADLERQVSVQSKKSNDSTGNVAAELSEAQRAEQQERLDLLYSLKKYMAGETDEHAGRDKTTYFAMLSINLMAWQIYPHPDTERNIDVVFEPEFNGIQTGLAILGERRDLLERRAEMVVEQIQNQEAELEPYRLLPPSESELEGVKKKQDWLETKKQQQVDLDVEIKRIESLLVPMEGRKQNLMTPFAPEDGPLGYNEQHDLRLPVVIPNGQAWMSCYLLTTGFHALHLIAGLLALFWWLPRKLDSARAPALFVTSMYWQFVDAVWLAIFWFIYL